jgi:Zn-dependent protease with chaperone function
MTEERWDGLARRLEDVARRRPKGYRARVAALAVLGYAYLLAVMAVLLAVVAAIGYAGIHGSAIVLKLALPFIALVVMIVRSLWVRLPPPEGIELDRATAGPLFDEIDEVRRMLATPRVHHVILDGELNAAMGQVPRLGVFGWQRNYLVVGLPLLQALTPEQFRAVLAHELGHLSGNHSRFSGWIYRVRRTWTVLLERLEAQRHWGAGVFRGFLRWYAPYFNAYSFALARADEYVADRAAVDAAGAEAAGAALVRLRMADWKLNARYWPDVFAGAEREAAPPRAAFAPMAGELAGLAADAEAGSVARAALSEETGTVDTHPSLRARLSGMGLRPEEAVERAVEGGDAQRSAAAALLGAAEETLTRRLDEDWHEAVKPSWREHNQRANEARQDLRELAARDRDGLDVDELVRMAQLVERFETATEAMALYVRAAELDPDDARAQFALGRLLIDEGDEAGIAHLEHAMARDPRSIVPGSNIAYAFLMEAGREAEAERWRERGLAHLTVERRAMAERETFEPGDDIDPHDLPESEVEAIEAQLSETAGLAGAYLVRKRVNHLADVAPCFVLGVVAFRTMDDERTAVLIHRLARELRMPGEFFVISLDGRWREMRERMERMPGAAVYGMAMAT